MIYWYKVIGKGYWSNQTFIIPCGIYIKHEELISTVHKIFDYNTRFFVDHSIRDENTLIVKVINRKIRTINNNPFKYLKTNSGESLIARMIIKGESLELKRI